MEPATARDRAFPLPVLPDGAPPTAEGGSAPGTAEVAAPAPASGRWRNPARWLPRLRWAVQGFFVLLTVLVGVEFALFHAEASAGGPVATSRPPGVEAFLPISALLGLRRFLETGAWDSIHPAGLTFLVAAIAGAVIARRAFCSWVCPFGTLSRGLEWARARFFRMPARWKGAAWVRWPLEALKFPLLGFFVWTVATMPSAGVEAFLASPYNRAADANMLRMLANLSGTGLAVIAGLVAFSLVVRNAWCRFLCPYGALLSVAGLLAPLRITRDPAVCKDCRACTRACPMGIRVAETRTVRSLECTSCASCVAACGVPGALEVRLAGRRRVRPWVPAAVALGVLLFAWLATVGTPFWETSLSPRDFVEAYRLGGK